MFKSTKINKAKNKISDEKSYLFDGYRTCRNYAVELDKC